MAPLRVLGLAGLLLAALLSAACHTPGHILRPVILPDDDRAAAAMRTAPEIVLVRITGLTMTGDRREVEKPSSVGGPEAPTIPLHLARIQAEVLLTVKGSARTNLAFYSWIWASGSHGGPRLFHPSPDGIRLVFLREEGGYLHTVGDYPSYDLEFSERWVPAIVADWKAGRMQQMDPLQRMVALRLRAELERLTEAQAAADFGADGPRLNHHWTRDMPELVRAAGPAFVVRELDDLCLHTPNRAPRFAACVLTARSFPGRCAAYVAARQALPDAPGSRLLTREYESCREGQPYEIDDLRTGRDGRWYFSMADLAPLHRRETLRLYVTAMDPAMRRAACAVALAGADADDFPKCRPAR